MSGPRRPQRATRVGLLLFAFAFAVMADPVSSIAYAIEAALRALHDHLGLLVQTMALVLAIIYLVKVNYDQLIHRFPEGGGAVAATGAAFGEGWAFLPLGALIVDFVLTIAISVAAAASAVIAYFPTLDSARVPIALGLLCFVAGLTWFGHIGRSVFAWMTVGFIAAALPVIFLGFLAPQGMGDTPVTGVGGGVTAFTVILAFPVAMALATGIEAPASAIAQLGQLDDRHKERFGHTTLWLTVLITAALTLSVSVIAVRLHVGLPNEGSTLIADVARTATGEGVWLALFQLTSSLLLLAAASSSFQAGPGLLKALARHTRPSGEEVGILAPALGRVNEHHTPYWSVVVYLGVSAAVVVAAGGHDQELVLFYAVAVFVSFLAGLLAMTRFSLREGDRKHLTINAVGAVVVAFTIVVNLRRGYPIVALAAALGIAGLFFWLWHRLGRPRGIAMVEIEGERELGEEEDEGE